MATVEDEMDDWFGLWDVLCIRRGEERREWDATAEVPEDVRKMKAEGYRIVNGMEYAEELGEEVPRYGFMKKILEVRV